jgi:hypothetical protein
LWLQVAVIVAVIRVIAASRSSHSCSHKSKKVSIPNQLFKIITKMKGSQVRDSEFIAFSILLLKTRMDYKPTEELIEDCKQIQCPTGTETWYPFFVQAVHKLIKGSKVNHPVVLIALWYLAKQTVQPDAVYKFLVSSLIVAQKLHSKSIFTMHQWSNFSGVSVEELVELEQTTLSQLQGHLQINSEIYRQIQFSFATLAQKRASNQLIH